MALLGVLVLGVWGAYAVLAAASPPAPSLLASPSASPTASTSITFTFTDTQSGVTFQCSRDGSTFAACTSPKSYSGLVEGSHSFRVQAVSAGKASSSASYSWVVDTAAPSVSSISRADANPTNAASLHWVVTFSEPLTGLAKTNFSLVQGGGITGQPAVTGISGSGTTWTVTASTGSGTPSSGAAVSLQLNLSSSSGIVDAAGNAPTATFSGTGSAYQVDKVAPAPVFDATPTDPNSVSTSNFTWHDGEAGVTYLCSTENGPFAAAVHGADGPDQPCASPLSYVVQTTSNGEHQLAVEAVDSAGNVSQPIGYKWKVGKGSIQDFTIDGNAPGLLYPGGDAKPIAVTLHNPNEIPISVTTVTVALHTADFPAGCDSSAFQVAQAAIPAAGVQVPANGSVTLPAQGATAPTVRMVDSGDQDDCKNLTFHFDYTGSAHS
jgi:hypothetical protein